MWQITNNEKYTENSITNSKIMIKSQIMRYYFIII